LACPYDSVEHFRNNAVHAGSTYTIHRTSLPGRSRRSWPSRFGNFNRVNEDCHWVSAEYPHGFRFGCGRRPHVGRRGSECRFERSRSGVGLIESRKHSK
jgi:hypothetical protein